MINVVETIGGFSGPKPRAYYIVIGYDGSNVRYICLNSDYSRLMKSLGPRVKFFYENSLCDSILS